MLIDSMSDKVFNKINALISAVILILVLYPLIYIISASISDPILVNQGKMWLYPIGITFTGFKKTFQYQDIWMGYKNTIFYTVVGTLINLFFTLTSAYALSRKDLIGRSFFAIIFVFTMFFSGGLIPTYLLVKSLGLYNTVWSMLILGAVGMWNIVIARTYFQTAIPVELKESAEIDGSSNTTLFIKIVLPLSSPIIAVLALFYGVGHWNAFFGALIYLSDRKLYPLQLILREILVLGQTTEIATSSSEAAVDMLEQIRLADIIKYSVMIVSILPVIMVYPFLQRYFVKGMMIGSIKG